MSRMAVYLAVFCYSLTMVFGTETDAQRKSLREITFEVQKGSYSLSELFEKIESTSDFKMAFLTEKDWKNKMVKVDAEHWNLYDLLEHVSNESGLSFKRINETISVDILSKSKKKETISVIEQQTISGKISDENGDALPGASIQEKSTANGTITDIEGAFTLEANEDATLVVSFVGYKTKEVDVQGRTTINISLDPDVAALSEVVVVGYGTQERKDVTGAISSISAEEIESLPITTVEGALQGRLAGVQIVQNGGVPGGGSTVKIRGIGTINNDEPLYVIDGIPVQTEEQDFRTGTSPLNSINPNDIASIDVLKDASAAAIYGSRASAGVVLITTKRGESGKLKVNYSGYAGVTSNANARLDNLLTKDQYLTYADNFIDQREADILANNPGAILPPRPTALSAPSDSLPGVDYYDQIFQTGTIQNHNVSISGGNQTSNYLVSLDYFKQEGTIKGTGFERYTARINSDHKVGNRIRIGESINVSYNDRDRIATDNFGIIELAAKMSPLLPPYNPANVGGVNQPGIATFGHEFDNPLAYIENYSDNQKSYNVLANIYGELMIIKDLYFKSEVGINFSYSASRRYNREFTLPQPNAIRQSSLSLTRNQNASPIYINSLNYRRAFGKHNVSATVAIEKVTNTFSSLRGNGQDLPPTNDANVLDNVDPATESVSGTESQWGLLSYLGRVSYNYMDKYYLTGSLRRDGSSRLTEDSRYETFPSFSLGWRLSEESFLSGIEFISDLKIRGGYGELGNVSSLGNYQTQVPVQNGITYVLGSNFNIVPGATVQRDSNPDIQWEFVKQTNVGLDLGLLQGRIILNADYFVKTTERMIYAPAYPASSGNQSAARNIGSMENKGFEIALTHRNQIGDFSYSVSGNLTAINNSLIKLSFADDVSVSSGSTTDQFGDMVTSRSLVGFPVGQIYGYVYEGIYQSGDSDGTAGDIRYKDINSADVDGNLVEGIPDGIIDGNDQTIIGNPLPDFTYGLTMNLGYKNFDFSMFIQGSEGNDLYNLTRQIMEAPRDLFNKTAAVLNAWTPTNTDTDIPRYNVPGSNYVRIHSRYVEDGSYMRVKNLILGYTLPDNLIQSAGLSKVRIYGTAQNLLTATQYSGIDPEVGSEDGSALALGIDGGRITPMPKIFMLGIQVGF